MPIVKILTRSTPSYGSLIDYLQKEGKGRGGTRPEIITHNFRGTTRDEWLQEFKENEAWRQRPRSNQIYLYHEIISFHHKDAATITRDMLEAMTEEYINLRGPDGMYLCAIHDFEDKQPHVHCAVSGVKFKTGMAHRLTKETLRELKVNLQEFQKDRWEKEMSHSLPNHGAGREYQTDAEYFLQKRKNERTNAKETLQRQVAEIYKEAKSQADYLQRLQNAGFLYYERNGVPTGIMLEDSDLKFRFSRLETPLEELPVERSEEERVLEEIRAIREARFDMERDEMDMERYIHLHPNSLFE